MTDFDNVRKASCVSENFIQIKITEMFFLIEKNFSLVPDGNNLWMVNKW